MLLDDLLKKIPDLEYYVKNMPPDIRQRAMIKNFPPNYIIHQKNDPIKAFGILCSGAIRIIYEFENGNIFTLQSDEAISFIGEVVIMAGSPYGSAAVETTTESTVLFISRSDFEAWASQDIHILGLVSKKIAEKLYRSAFELGAKRFYSPSFLLLDFLMNYGRNKSVTESKPLVVSKTRHELHEELGMNTKTLDRTIKKLSDEQVISVIKGKITLSRQQYLNLSLIINDYI